MQPRLYIIILSLLMAALSHAQEINVVIPSDTAKSATEVNTGAMVPEVYSRIYGPSLRDASASR